MRSAALIQAEIDALEEECTKFIQSAGTGGTSISRADYTAKTMRLDRLYQMLDRATGVSPMLVRGVARGLR